MNRYNLRVPDSIGCIYLSLHPEKYASQEIYTDLCTLNALNFISLQAMPHISPFMVISLPSYYDYF